MTLTSSDAVLAAERRRAAAFVARDLAALRAGLHDALVYVHATGTRHGKADLLDFVARGPDFLAVDFDAEPTALSGDAVLLHGKLRLHLRRAGETDSVHATSWASALWVRDAAGCATGDDAAVSGGASAADRWRLRLFQSTKATP